MPDPSLSAAIREAYASAPADVVTLHTLELRHPAFRDDDGNPTAIRIVRDHVDLWARLETGAPLDGGATVRFVAMAFEVELPAVDTAPVPEITVTLDNVGREIVRHLDEAAISQDRIEVTYRPYLSSDLEGPQMDPPITLVLSEVDVDSLKVTGRARMLDIGNKVFPSETYTAQRFPGLAR